MIKSANLEEEYFVVLTFNYSDLKPVLEIQKAIAEHYNLYKREEYPELHITIDRIKKDSFIEAKKVLEKVVDDAKKIQVKVTDFKCFQLSNNSLTLQVDKTEGLKKLSNKIHDRLGKNGISTIDKYNQWNFHITLVSNHFVETSIPNVDFDKLCYLLEGKEYSLCTSVEAVEIWRPVLDPNKKQVASFELS